MANNLFTLRPTAGISPCAASASPNRKTNSSWWSPLFGWSSEPDYFNEEQNKKKKKKNAVVSLRSDEQRKRFKPGCLTEEKARRLRLMTWETETFHDAMYHSAIASRLATDFKNRR